MLVHLLEPGPVGLLTSVWSPKPGMGKSMAAKLACGIWHDPTEVLDAKGATDFALYLSAGLKRNLPLVVDELTTWAPERSRDFAYRYSSGRSKEQGAASGGLRDNSHLNWGNTGILTGNVSQREIIKAGGTECLAELARVFEFEFTAGHDVTMTTEEGRVVLDQLIRMRGLPGEVFAAYVVKNRESIQALLLATYTKLMDAARLSKDARFWGINAATVWVAYQITKALKLHSFDGPALLTWIVEKLRDHEADSRNAATDYCGMFAYAITELHPGFIVTTERGSKGDPARLAPGWQMPRGSVTGRVIVSEGLLALSVHAVTDWCRHRRVDKTQMMDAVAKAGWLLGTNNVRLGSHTTMAIPAIRAYELDWAKFSGRVRLAADHGALTEGPTLADDCAGGANV
jgi:hypothetical protein